MSYDGNGETTEWVYGVSTAHGSDINSNDMVSATEQPNPSTGAADSSIETTVTVDALGETITSTDPDSIGHTYVYDVLGQLVADEVTDLPSGIDGSVRQIGTTYTTLGDPQYITTYSVAGGGPDYIVNQVEDVYNGLDQLVQQYQSVNGAVGEDTPSVQYNYTDLADGNNSRLTSIVYPDGYTVDYNYNTGLDSDISRLSSISDFTGTLQSYQYLGLDTIVVMDEPEADMELTYLTTDDETGSAGDEYVGLNRFGEVVDQNWYNTSTDTSVVDIQYGYDDDGNVLYQNNTLESSQSELFTYDGLGQLTSYEQGTLSDDNTVIASPSISETWGYDPLGNHLTDSTTTTGTTTITCTFNYDNQITSISSGTTPTYDADGNMTKDQSGLTYTYNAWGQEVDVYSGDTLEENYTYDGLGDRMTNTVGSTTTNLFNSTAGQVLEEQVGTEYTQRYVWSTAYVNQMVDRDNATSDAGLSAEGSNYTRLWSLQDANYNTVALVAMSDDTATVVERYAYDPFGTVTYMTGSYGSESGSAYGWVYLFQGGRLDEITNDTHFGARNENSALGVWTSEDPTGFAGRDVDLNGFEGNGAVDRVDPTGLQEQVQGVGKTYVPGVLFPVTTGVPQGQTLYITGTTGTGVGPGQNGTNGEDVYYASPQYDVLIIAFGAQGSGPGLGNGAPGGSGGGSGRIQVGTNGQINATGGGGAGGGAGPNGGGQGGMGGAVGVYRYVGAWYDSQGVEHPGHWVTVAFYPPGVGSAGNGQVGGGGGGGANVSIGPLAGPPIWAAGAPANGALPGGNGGAGGLPGAGLAAGRPGTSKPAQTIGPPVPTNSGPINHNVVTEPKPPSNP